MANSHTAQLAVFIDMDNLSVTALEILLSRWRYRQTPVVMRRAYGGLDKLKGASALLQRHGFHVRANHGKGTTDVLLTVDVMDALHAGALPPVVAIASSDADFVPLVWRLRDAGHRVVGIAEHAMANAEVLSAAYHDMEWCDAVAPIAPVAVAPPAPVTAPPLKPITAGSVVQTAKPVARTDSGHAGGSAVAVATPAALSPVTKTVPQVLPAAPPFVSSPGLLSVAPSVSLPVAHTALPPAARTGPPKTTSKATSPATPSPPTKGAAVAVDLSKAKAMVKALQPWQLHTVKPLQQAGTLLRAQGLVSGSKPLHTHFRPFPGVFQVMPSSGPARMVKLLKLP